MTAGPSAIPESKAAEQRAHEPSMEEILASIRKIISDDQAAAAPAPAPRAAQEEPAVVERVQDRTAERSPERERPVDAERAPARAAASEVERMRMPPVARPSFDLSGAFVGAPPPRSPRPERAEARPSAQASAELREIGPRPAPTQPAPRLVAKEEQPLLSDQSDAIVASSFQVLNAVRSPATPQLIENVARELLRPMLKRWLDDNLPPLVERLVRAEIERLSRGS